MTAVTATRPVAEPRTEPQRPTPRRLSVGAAIFAMTAAVARAFDMAYVAPYQMGRRRPPESTEAQDGRDPAW